MWIDKYDEPIPTYGNDGKEFLLNLEYGKYFGRDHDKTNEVVTAIWSSLHECFFEKTTGLTIDDREIVEWFKER